MDDMNNIIFWGKKDIFVIVELATNENNQRRDSIKPSIMITNHSYVFLIKKAKKIKKVWTLNSLSEQGKAERNKKDRFFERKKKINKEDSWRLSRRRLLIFIRILKESAAIKKQYQNERRRKKIKFCGNIKDNQNF